MSSSVAALTTVVFPVDIFKEPVAFKKGSAFIPHWLHHIHRSGLTLTGGHGWSRAGVLSSTDFVSVGLSYAEA